MHNSACSASGVDVCNLASQSACLCTCDSWSLSPCEANLVQPVLTSVACTDKLSAHTGEDCTQRPRSSIHGSGHCSGHSLAHTGSSTVLLTVHLSVCQSVCWCDCSSMPAAFLRPWSPTGPATMKAGTPCTTSWSEWLCEAATPSSPHLWHACCPFLGTSYPSRGPFV